jgi:hypothetical protein
MKISPVGAELVHADRNDEGNSHFSHHDESTAVRMYAGV